MKMELVGPAQSGKTEVDITAGWAGAGHLYSVKQAEEALGIRRDLDEDKPTPEWTQGVKVELD